MITRLTSWARCCIAWFSLIEMLTWSTSMRFFSQYTSGAPLDTLSTRCTAWLPLSPLGILTCYNLKLLTDRQSLCLNQVSNLSKYHFECLCPNSISSTYNISAELLTTWICTRAIVINRIMLNSRHAHHQSVQAIVRVCLVRYRT